MNSGVLCTFYLSLLRFVSLWCPRYVFGTFTNCFTFAGKNSWSSSKRDSTRMLIGWYWVFTIIITSCYTGSIIAFVTLPVFPTTVNTISELLAGFFRVGTLGKGRLLTFHFTVVRFSRGFSPV